MKRWQIVTLIIFLGILGAGLGVIRFLMPYDLDAELASARAQGIPTSYKEMAVPPFPPEQDAAADYERARAIQKKHDFTNHEYEALDRLVARKPVTAAEKSQLRRTLHEHADYLAAINAGALKPHSTRRTKAEGNTATFPDFPNFAHAREAAKALKYESLLLTLDGRPIEAARTAALGYNVGKQMREQSSAIALLVAIAIDSITEQGLQFVLLSSPPNGELARLVREAAGKDLSVPDLHHALLGEVASYAQFSPTSMPPQPQAKEASLKDRLLSKSQLAAVIHWQIRVIQASSTAEPARRAAIQRVADDLRKRGTRSPAFELALQTADVGPSLEDSCLRRAAQRRTLYAAACVLDFRARTGRYPGVLADAVKPVPLDPFDLKPLAYKRTTKGFEVTPVAASANLAASGLASRKIGLAFTYTAP